MRIYRVVITGRTPLILHSDNIEWADVMKKWEKDSKNKAISVRGDDRSPAWRWIGCLYHDNEYLCVPSDNIMRGLMEGGAMVPTGKGAKTFKAQTQSGCIVGEPFWKLNVRGQFIRWADVKTLINQSDFDKHQEFAAAHGFMLYLKRAVVNNRKHIRVRPRFDQWEISGTLNVWDPQLTHDVISTIWKSTGEYKGIGDWRPGGGKTTPGPYGTFDVNVEPVEADKEKAS